MNRGFKQSMQPPISIIYDIRPVSKYLIWRFITQRFPWAGCLILFSFFQEKTDEMT